MNERLTCAITRSYLLHIHEISTTFTSTCSRFYLYFLNFTSCLLFMLMLESSNSSKYLLRLRRSAYISQFCYRAFSWCH